MRVPAFFGPIAATIGGIGVLCLMDGLVKYLSAFHATPQVVAMRYGFGALAALAVFLAAGTPWPRRTALRPHMWRAVVIFITATTFFYALATLPLAVALSLSFTAPIFIALLARLALKERPGGPVVAALALGFGGVLVVLWDELGRAGPATSLGIAAALVSAVSYAISMITLKTRAALDPVPSIVLLQNAFTLVLAAPAAAMVWTAPTAMELTLFAAVGVLGTTGHLALAFAYGRAEASRLGVLEYTAFVWAALIGLIAFGEVPSPITLLGAAFIVAGALLVGRSRTAEPEAEIGP
ncbi:MAG TPA: DMT family transporter [Xanthobacteraceae bacterium]|nr:DMT family transporter [Xanthobacteraceae bacterium]